MAKIQTVENEPVTYLSFNDYIRSYHTEYRDKCFKEYIRLVGINSVIKEIYDRYTFDFEMMSEPVTLLEDKKMWGIFISLWNGVVALNCFIEAKDPEKIIATYYYKIGDDKRVYGNIESFDDVDSKNKYFKEALYHFFVEYEY